MGGRYDVTRVDQRSTTVEAKESTWLAVLDQTSPGELIQSGPLASDNAILEVNSTIRWTWQGVLTSCPGAYGVGQSTTDL